MKQEISVWLECVSGQYRGQRIPLQEDEILLGRSKVCDLQLPGSNISRTHARIRFAQGKYYLQDQDSALGTKVNGQEVRATALQDGDTFSIGETTFRFRREARVRKPTVPQADPAASGSAPQKVTAATQTGFPGWAIGAAVAGGAILVILLAVLFIPRLLDDGPVIPLLNPEPTPAFEAQTLHIAEGITIDYPESWEYTYVDEYDGNAEFELAPSETTEEAGVYGIYADLSLVDEEVPEGVDPESPRSVLTYMIDNEWEAEIDNLESRIQETSLAGYPAARMAFQMEGYSGHSATVICGSKLVWVIVLSKESEWQMYEPILEQVMTSLDMQ
jgi:hypothetical protein